MTNNRWPTAPRLPRLGTAANTTFLHGAMPNNNNNNKNDPQAQPDSGTTVVNPTDTSSSAQSPSSMTRPLQHPDPVDTYYTLPPPDQTVLEPRPLTQSRPPKPPTPALQLDLTPPATSPHGARQDDSANRRSGSTGHWLKHIDTQILPSGANFLTSAQHHQHQQQLDQFSSTSRQSLIPIRSAQFSSDGSPPMSPHNTVLDLSKLVVDLNDTSARISAGALGELFCGAYYRSPVAVRRVQLPNTPAPTDHAEVARQRLVLARFADNIRAYEHVRHPAIAQFIGVAAPDPSLVDPASSHEDPRLSNPPCALIVAEYMSGGNLQDAMDVLRSSRKGDHAGFQVPTLVSVVTQVASGLMALHQKGLAHGDLAPCKIYLAQQPNRETGAIPPACAVKISDFGLILPNDFLINTTASSIGASMAGGIQYRAPEAMTGAELDAKATQAGDIFSLGVIMYEMFTLIRPWFRMDMFSVINAVAHRGERPRWPIGNSLIPDSLKNLVENMWSQQPGDRPTVGAVYDTLQSLCSTYSLTASGPLTRLASENSDVSPLDLPEQLSVVDDTGSRGDWGDATSSQDKYSNTLSGMVVQTRTDGAMAARENEAGSRNLIMGNSDGRTVLNTTQTTAAMRSSTHPEPTGKASLEAIPTADLSSGQIISPILTDREGVTGRSNLGSDRKFDPSLSQSSIYETTCIPISADTPFANQRGPFSSDRESSAIGAVHGAGSEVVELHGRQPPERSHKAISGKGTLPVTPALTSSYLDEVPAEMTSPDSDDAPGGPRSRIPSQTNSRTTGSRAGGENSHVSSQRTNFRGADVYSRMDSIEFTEFKKSFVSTVAASAHKRDQEEEKRESENPLFTSEQSLAANRQMLPSSSGSGRMLDESGSRPLDALSVRRKKSKVLQELIEESGLALLELQRRGKLPSIPPQERRRIAGSSDSERHAALKEQDCVEAIVKAQQALDYSAVLAVVRSVPDSVVVARAGLAALKVIGESETVFYEACEEGAIDELVATMNRHEKDPEVCALFCRAMHAFVSWYDDRVGHLVRAVGGPGTIVTAMSDHRSNMDVQKAGCLALATVCSASELNRHSCVTMGGPLVLYQAMSRNLAVFKDAELAKFCLDVFRRMADKNAEAASALLKVCALDTVCRCAQIFGSDDLDEHVLGALEAVAHHGEGRSLIIRSGGMKAVATVMNRSNDAEFLRRGCRFVVLVSLLRVPECEDQIVMSGVMEQVVRALRMSKDVPSTTAQPVGPRLAFEAAQALAFMASFGSDVQDRCRLVHGVHAVRDSFILFASHAATVKMLARAVLNLCKDNPASISLAQENGVCEAMLQTLTSQKDEPVITELRKAINVVMNSDAGTGRRRLKIGWPGGKTDALEGVPRHNPHARRPVPAAEPVSNTSKRDTSESPIVETLNVDPAPPVGDIGSDRPRRRSSLVGRGPNFNILRRRGNRENDSRPDSRAQGPDSPQDSGSPRGQMLALHDYSHGRNQ